MKTKAASNKTREAFIYVCGVVGLGIVYHLAARLGLLMANVQPNTSPVWPPTGIAIAALLLFGIKYWPGIALGVIFGYLFNNNALNVSIGLAIGNTLEAVTAVYLLKRFTKIHNRLDRIQDVIGLAAFCALCTTISASVGVITLLLVGSKIQPVIWTVWYTWWIGDFMGALVITPLLLVWVTSLPIRWSAKKIFEAAVELLLLFAVTAYVFTNDSIGTVTHEAMIYVIFPFVIYAALRFTQFGAVNAVTLVSGVAIYGTVIGSGPLVRSSLNDSLILLQTFMGVVSITALTLAATTSQRQSAESALQKKVTDLALLNDSSQTFLGIFETQEMYDTVCKIVVEKFDVSTAWIEINDSTGNGRSILAPVGMNEKEIRNLIKSESKDPAIENSMGKLSLSNHNSLLRLPLKFGGKQLGQLALLSKDSSFFSNDRIVLLDSYANLAAVAIQNTWLLDQVKTGNENLHALSHRLMEVQESERLHLSRELHDESGQVISAMMVQLGLLERDANKPELIKKHASELKHIAADVLSNLHEMAVRLRPASLDHLGLVTALDQYIEDFGRQHNLHIQFESIGLSNKRHSLEIETTLFRVVQESLTNVLLHAKATQVDVLLSQRKRTLNVVIEDNGIGFIPENVSEHTHLGLFGMRERVEMLGGKLSIESSIGQGSTIQAEVPCGD
jgi:signal transduction histidine kinase